jgi:hypothetical protein
MICSFEAWFVYHYEYDGVIALPARFAWPEEVMAPHIEK